MAQLPEFVLEWAVLFENLDLPAGLIQDDNLLDYNLEYNGKCDKINCVVLSFKEKTPMVIELKKNRFFKSMQFIEEEMIRYTESERIVKDNLDVNGLVASKIYYGSVTKVYFTCPFKE